MPKKKLIIPNSWVFNEEVSINFDDHVKKSIPNYNYLQNIIAEISSNFIKNNSIVYDFGCSTGNTFLELIKLNLGVKFSMVGFDKSKKMIEIAKYKFPNEKKIKFFCVDILKKKLNKQSDLILSILLLPFFNIEEKTKFFDKCFKSLKKKGALLLVDKNISTNSLHENIFNLSYENFKLKKNLSAKEVLNKKNSLKSSMTILSLSELKKIIVDSGFEEKNISIFHKNLNFTGLLITK